MRITTTKTYTSFTHFRKSKKRFDRIGFTCVSTDITKKSYPAWNRISIIATYCKEDGDIDDIANI